MHLLNSHIALFQSSENPTGGLQTQSYCMIQSYGHQKIRKCKGFITKEFDRFGNHSCNAEMSLNCKSGIVINAISIRKTMFDYISRCNVFVRDIGRDNLFQCFTNLTKKSFENLEKAKNFSSLKFSICLIQRGIIYLMAKHYIDFRAYFKCK